MPLKYKRKIKRKSFNTRKKKSQGNFIGKFPTSGIPQAIQMKMLYGENLSVNTSSVAASKVIRMNGLFDPEQSAVGHQPYYRDQIAVLYERYTVHGFKIELTGTCTTGSMFFGFKTQADTTVLSTASLGIERPDCKYALVVAGGQPRTISHYYPINRVFGVSKSKIMDEDNFSAEKGSDPVEQHYLQTFAQHADDSSTCIGVLTHKVTYYCRWYDRTRHAAS